MNCKIQFILLIFIADLLTRHNIPFWVDAGTLLGFYRENNTIEGDDDADFGIPGKYTQDVKNLIPIVENDGHTLIVGPFL